MLTYKPAALYQSVSPPHASVGRYPGPASHFPPAYRPPTPALGHKHLSQTFDEIMGWPPAAGDVLRLMFHGGTTWMGIRVGITDKNKWVSSIAWVLAVGNGLAAIADIISLVKRATGTHPPAKSQAG